MAVILARESKGLLVGESATPKERQLIRAAAEDADVIEVGKVVTQYLGPDTVLVLMDVTFRNTLASQALGAAVDRMEANIRKAGPAVKHIYIEAESLRDTQRQQAR